MKLLTIPLVLSTVFAATGANAYLYNGQLVNNTSLTFTTDVTATNGMLNNYYAYLGSYDPSNIYNNLNLVFNGGGLINNGRFTLYSGNLTTTSTIIGNGPSADTLNIHSEFYQSGGTHTVSGSLVVGSVGYKGLYYLNEGTLNAGSISVDPANGTFTWGAGTVNLTSDVTITSGGLFGSSLSMMGRNSNTSFNNAYVFKNLSTSNLSVAYDGEIKDIQSNVTANGVLENNGVMSMVGGTVSSSGQKTNNGLISGFGTIGGAGGLINNAQITQSGGHLVFANTGINTNYGNIDLASGYQMRLNGSTLNNSGGTVNLNGAIVNGTGTLNNNIGGTIAGHGTISSNLSNTGVIAVSGGTLNVTKAFSNGGVIQLTSPTSTIAGGAISNVGTIQGNGNVANNINNTGVIEAIGGALNLSGSINNNGRISASSGTKVLAVNGISTNAGIISLSGGSFDNNSHALTNSGQVSGYGTLSTSDLQNNGSITLSGGTATINGAVANQAGGRIEAAHNTTVFTGNVVNNGTFKTTGANVTFAGNYTENGVYISDPSVNNFSNLIIGTGGYLIGGIGDEWHISGDFINNSLQSTQWNTDNASLFLDGSGLQNLYLAGADLGATLNGSSNNFSWGEFSLSSGVSAKLWDGNADPGGAFYVGLFELGGGVGQMSDIFSDYNIYYDPSLAGNTYLGGQSFALNGSGYLAPMSTVPIPNAVWLFGSGLLGLIGFARRKAA